MGIAIKPPLGIGTVLPTTAIRRRVGLLLLTLCAVLFLPPTSASASAYDAPPTSSGSTIDVLPGSAHVLSELAVPPTLVAPPGTVSFSVVDVLSGRTVSPRSLERTPSGTRLQVPQLPVGTYRVLLDNNQATLEVRPEAAEPVELTGLTPHTPRSPALIAVVVAAVILIVVLLRSSRFLLALVLAVATVVTSSVLVPSPTRPNGTWETCLSIMEGTPRERDLARRNCKVRTLLEMLGPRAENREEVESFLENNTDSICHEVAHLAGFYFSRVTPDPATASRAMMKGCNDGMAHGVLEALSLFNDDDEFLRVTNDMCAGFSDLQMQRTCAHGLGHATVWRTNGNLESAAEICMRTTDTRTYGMTFMFGRPTLPLTDGTFSSQAECISAATMEWADRWEFERREGATRTLIPELEEPMDACIREGLPETFYVGCYLGTSYRNRDTVEAAKRCNFVAPYPVSCFAALGDNLSLFTEANLGRELSPAIVVEFSSACLLANDRDAAEACSAAVAYRHMLDIKDVGYMTDLCADFDTILLQDCMRGTALARDVLLSRGYPVG